MNGKSTIVFFSLAVLGFVLLLNKDTINFGQQGNTAILKIQNNKFLTPKFLYVKSGVFKDGSAFESYTFTNPVRIKQSIQSKAQDELKDYTGCVEVRIENSKSSNGSNSSYQINEFKKTDCPITLN